MADRLKRRTGQKHATYSKSYRKEIESRETKPEVCPICVECKELVFEHCHTTGLFRGWICAKCNVILGMAGDNRWILLRASNYLKKFDDKLGQLANGRRKVDILSSVVR